VIYLSNSDLDIGMSARRFSSASDMYVQATQIKTLAGTRYHDRYSRLTSFLQENGIIHNSYLPNSFSLFMIILTYSIHHH